MNRATVTFAILAALISLPTLTRSAEEKPAATTGPATKPDAGTKFYGVVMAVDASAKTFTIDNQVYRVVADTQMTKAADDSPATLADAQVGQPARGSFTKAADGQLNVTKVRFGRKTGGKAGGGKSGGKKKADSAATTQQ